jgi:FixJ family two-component response regulator
MSCVYVIDDDASVLKATSRLLRAAGFEVRPFASALAYLGQFEAEAPGCLVLDLNMPEMSGLQLQHALVERGGAPAIVFLSGRADIPMSVEAMKGGAVEFLEKPVDAVALVAAVRAALDADHRQRALRAGRTAVAKRLATLTPREAEVLRGVVAGKLNKQIASDLGTAEKTIKVHRGRMMEKMQVDSVAALVHAAARVDID